MVPAPRIDFRQLSVSIAHPRDHDGELLVRHCQRLGCRVRVDWPPAESLGGIDVLYCFIDQQTKGFLGIASTLSTLVIVGIAEPGNAATLSLLDEVTPHAVLIKPIHPGAILTNLVVARNNSRYQRRLLGKVAKLEETLRAFRRVERAKGILMERRKIGESEAYTFLREQAMRKRVSIGVVASAVIESSEVLADDRD